MAAKKQAKKNTAKLKIAVLYVCTGRYKVFWKDFYRTSENFLFKNQTKKYFIFTDDLFYFIRYFRNVKLTKIKKENWPNNTLYRFRYFLKRKKMLSKYDLIYFFNANCLFVENIAEDIMPNNEKELVGVKHPGFYDKMLTDFTYERNKNSSAYIPFGEGNYYFMGGVNGGFAKPYIDMCETLNKNINEDFKNKIVAIWHDESYLNHYYFKNSGKVKILNPDYGFPEGWGIPFCPKIIIRDKHSYGGHDYLRSL